jgi:hypothetical protein
MKRLVIACVLLFAVGAFAKTEKQVLLFVQVADSGSLIPKEGSPGQFVLTLNGIAPQTVYFSDRPSRVAGHVTTGSFLEGLGFSDNNPPNAAIEVAQAAADEDTIIVELRHPVYDGAKATLRYDVTIMPDAKGGLAYYSTRRDDKLPRQFSNVSLFIDDCPGATITCTNNKDLLHPCGTFQTTSGICYKVVVTSLGPVGACTLCDYNICTEKYPQCCPTMTDCQSASQVANSQPGQPPPPQSPLSGAFRGTVASISGNLWTIKGETRSMIFTVDSTTRIFPNLKVGDKVNVMYGKAQGGVIPALMIAPGG